MKQRVFKTDKGERISMGVVVGKLCLAASLQFIGLLTAFSQKEVEIEMTDFTPRSVVAGSPFRNKHVDVSILLKIASKVCG